MSTRIADVFETKKPGGPAFIPFLMAGDPDPARSVKVITAVAEAGADIIELGVPFSDPVADGPTIQRAAERALAHNVQLADVLELVRQVRALGVQTPILLFTYLNPLYQMGFDVFARAAVQAGVDGVLVVDLPPEEATEFCAVMDAAGLARVFLASPTTSDARLKQIAVCSTGFVYYVSRAGVTGAQADLPPDLIARIAHVRGVVQKPVCVGFGISTPEQAHALAPYADGIVVGSALVAEIGANRTLSELGAFCRALKP